MFIILAILRNVWWRQIYIETRIGTKFNVDGDTGFLEVSRVCFISILAGCAEAGSFVWSGLCRSVRIKGCEVMLGVVIALRADR